MAAEAPLQKGAGDGARGARAGARGRRADRARAPRRDGRRPGRGRAVRGRRRGRAARRRSRAAGRRADGARGRLRARAGRGSAPPRWSTRRSRSTAPPATRTASPPRSGEQGFYDIVHGRLERSERRLSEALELRRQLGDDRRLVEPLIDYAWLDLARGDGEAARSGFLDCLALARHVGDRFNVAEALAGLSTQAAARRAPRRRRAARGGLGGDPRTHRRTAVGVAGRDPRAGAGAGAAGRSATTAFARLEAEGRRLPTDEAVARSRGAAPAEPTARFAR